MANLRRRNLRVARVVCAPPLARIHERLFRALGIRENGKPGAPGGSCVFLSDVGELEAFALNYFASEWLSKLDDGKPSPTKDAATWERFSQAESSCFEVNQRLKREWASSPWSQEIRLATKLVSKILGRFNWDEAERGFGWGPGATTRLTRRESDAAHKFSGSPESTIGNAILANTVIQCSPLWSRELPTLSEAEGVGYVKIVDGNCVVTVPKNYKMHRAIAVEPDMNIYVQKGIGAMIRSRLQRVGLDLNDQTRNQRLARVGSIAGSLATIDLSMASDTLSRAVVELMAPPDWLDALGQCRSPFGVLPSGEKIFYQKFSSMGNGATFELESLIFYTLALAVCHLMGEEVSRVSVFGDDIVVPSAAAARFMGLLEYMGFTPNAKKSFMSGPFRESCGKHYYLGRDVTPFYVKKAPRTLMDLFKVHNQIYRLIQRWEWLNNEKVQDLYKVLRWLRNFAPSSYRKPRLVDGIGDGGFVGSFDEVAPKLCRRGWDGYRCESIITLPVPDFSYDSPGLLVKALSRNKRSSQRDISENEAYEVARWLDTLSPFKKGRGRVEVLPLIKGKERHVLGSIYVSRAFVHGTVLPRSPV